MEPDRTQIRRICISPKKGKNLQLRLKKCPKNETVGLVFRNGAIFAWSISYNNASLI